MDEYYKKSEILSRWLAAVCASIVFMIFLGGLTRLTESGLAITEWNPVVGVIPPITEDTWNVEFEKYKQFPEYIKHNFNLTLSDFKLIYWLEYFHRLVGRLVVLLYVIPMIYFIQKKLIKWSESLSYISAFVLFAGQGYMGWYMVKSGLDSDPYISHYRLVMHLMFAIFLYIILFRKFMENTLDTMSFDYRTIDLHNSYYLNTICMFVFVIQVIFGGFVAGLDGGMIYNSFPLMDSGFVAEEMMIGDAVRVSTDDAASMQFMHRIFGCIQVIVVILFFARVVTLQDKRLVKHAIYVLLAVMLQFSLGVITLVYQVPIFFALMHQLGAILFLSSLMWVRFLMKPSVDLETRENYELQLRKMQQVRR